MIPAKRQTISWEFARTAIRVQPAAPGSCRFRLSGGIFFEEVDRAGPGEGGGGLVKTGSNVIVEAVVDTLVATPSSACRREATAVR